MRLSQFVATLALAAGWPAFAFCPPAAPTLMLERFVPADCEKCWAASPPSPGSTLTERERVFALDWIVPSAARGDEAPLAAAAVAEARERATRAGSLSADEALSVARPIPRRSGALKLEITDGPALNGYVALRFVARTNGGALPGGIAGYMALVERVPAGEEGSPVDRQLVRAQVGPLPLDGLRAGVPIEHFRAIRLPETAKAERLAAVAWVERGEQQRVLAISASPSVACPASP